MAKSEIPKGDVRISTHSGSIYLFQLLTPEAHAWVAKNVQLEGWQWLGANAFGVSEDLAKLLAADMQAAGLNLV